MPEIFNLDAREMLVGWRFMVSVGLFVLAFLLMRQTAYMTGSWNLFSVYRKTDLLPRFFAGAALGNLVLAAQQSFWAYNEVLLSRGKCDHLDKIASLCEKRFELLTIAPLINPLFYAGFGLGAIMVAAPLLSLLDQVSQTRAHITLVMILSAAWLVGVAAG